MGNLISFPQPPLAPAEPDGSSRRPRRRIPAGASPVLIGFEPRPADPYLRLLLPLHLLQRKWQAAKSALGRRALAFWTRAGLALLLAFAVCFSMGASNSGSRLQNLDHRLMCTCGCAQLLGECNHVGCTESTQELSELRADIAGGMTDQQVFDAFVAKYGATVLAAPPASGFDLVAWIAPFAVFLAALLGTILLIRRWGGLRGFHPQPGASADLAALDPTERARIEQIRRDTDPGFEGGVSR